MSVRSRGLTAAWAPASASLSSPRVSAAAACTDGASAIATMVSAVGTPGAFVGAT